MLLLTGRVAPGRSTRGPYQSGLYPPSSGYPGTALGHSGAPAGGWSDPPPPYSACASCPGSSAARPSGSPASASPAAPATAPAAPAVTVSPANASGYGQPGLGLVFGPNGVVQTISGMPHVQGLPAITSSGSGSTFHGMSALGGPIAFSASALPAIAGPQQLQLLQYPSQRSSRSSEWSTRIREVSPVRVRESSPVRIREISPVRTRVSYVDRPRERECVPPSIIRTPRSDRSFVGTGISRSNSMRSVASNQETGIRGYVDRSSEGFEE